MSETSEVIKNKNRYEDKYGPYGLGGYESRVSVDTQPDVNGYLSGPDNLQAPDHMGDMEGFVGKVLTTRQTTNHEVEKVLANLGLPNTAKRISVTQMHQVLSPLGMNVEQQLQQVVDVHYLLGIVKAWSEKTGKVKNAGQYFEYIRENTSISRAGLRKLVILTRNGFTNITPVINPGNLSPLELYNTLFDNEWASLMTSYDPSEVKQLLADVKQVEPSGKMGSLHHALMESHRAQQNKVKTESRREREKHYRLEEKLHQELQGAYNAAPPLQPNTEPTLVFTPNWRNVGISTATRLINQTEVTTLPFDTDIIRLAVQCRQLGASMKDFLFKRKWVNNLERVLPDVQGVPNIHPWYVTPKGEPLHLSTFIENDGRNPTPLIDIKSENPLGMGMGMRPAIT